MHLVHAFIQSDLQALHVFFYQYVYLMKLCRYEKRSTNQAEC